MVWVLLVMLQGAAIQFVYARLMILRQEHHPHPQN
ncbi:MAG: Uncharacterised protein [Alphaproteobacteria bacterium UBA4588]|nr:MAG: Uncharacterised protein [Alphaproteobacteria bacterium UBA4588]